MLDGMKMATQGMLAMSAKQDVIANNLANVGTAGFRKDTFLVSSFSQVLDKAVSVNDGYMQAGGELETNTGFAPGTATYFSQGSLKETGNNFDLALDDNGKGFFTVQTQEGIKFTRNGSFRLSSSGYLVTQDGSFVLGQHGPIKLAGDSFAVTNDGAVKVNEKDVDRLLITTFADTRGLQKQGDTNFVSRGGATPAKDFFIKQGYLEMANVNAVKEMVDMMTVMRTYEANQKVLQSQDQMLGKSANEIGKLR